MEEWEPLYIVCGNVNWCISWKTVWRVLRKLKIGLPYDPAVPLLGYISEENKNTNSKTYMHPDVHSSINYNSQDMETT